MILINLEPELSIPITKPHENETLQDWLARKFHTKVAHSLELSLQQLYNKEGEKNEN